MTKLTQLIEHYCPDGVEYVRLGDVATYYRGLTYSKKNEVESGGLKVLRANNVSLDTQRIDWNDVKSVELDKPVKRTCLLKQDDILMVANSGSKAHVGKIAYINQDFVDVAFGGFMATIRTKDSRSSRYVYHVLCSDEFKAYKDRVLSSATINNLKKSIVEEFQIPLPPREVQDAIVERLDAFAKLIERLDSEIALREKRFEYYREQLLSFDESVDVEYVELKEVLRYEQPGKYLVSSTDYDDGFSTPVLTAGKTFVLGYTDEKTGIYEASPDDPVMIFDDFTTAFKWVDFPFKAKSSAMKILTLAEVDSSFRYIFYAMHDVGVDVTDHKRQWIRTYSKEKIPLPPREVQQEIVDKLDTMKALIDNLKQERELRGTQFEYYREKLLTFNS